MSRADVVIAGAGIAGLVTALELAPRRVIVLSKRALGRGAASSWAQGGIAAAVGDDDSPELHALDTIEVGGGINDSHAVDVLTREAPQRIHDLLDLGATFDVDTDGDFELGREAAQKPLSSRRPATSRLPAAGFPPCPRLLGKAPCPRPRRRRRRQPPSRPLRVLQAPPARCLAKPP